MERAIARLNDQNHEARFVEEAEEFSVTYSVREYRDRCRGSRCLPGPEQIRLDPDGRLHVELGVCIAANDKSLLRQYRLGD